MKRNRKNTSLKNKNKKRYEIIEKKNLEKVVGFRLFLEAGEYKLNPLSLQEKHLNETFEFCRLDL